jgi:Flp pilus assembly protein TadG
MKRHAHSANANRGRRGNVMLEFGIGAGVLFSVFTATFQFGYTFYQYNLLKNAAANGAQYAALRTYDSNSASPSNAFTKAVQNVVVYGDPAGGTRPVVPGLTTGNVHVTPVWSTTGSGGVPLGITVSITGYSIGAVFATMNCTGKPFATYPYIGVFAPY